MSKASPQISLPFVTLQKDQPAPLYRQLYEQIRSAILNRLLQPGERLPATRILAEELQVSRNCILQAFEQLTLEGYLGGRTGAGTFVAENLPSTPLPPPAPKPRHNAHTRTPSRHTAAKVQYPLPLWRLEKEGDLEPVIPFQTGIPAFDAFPFTTWQRIAVNRYRYLSALHLGYDDAQGHLPLREAVAGHLRINRSVNCTAEQIVIVNGSRQGIFLAAQLLLNKGDQCWMEDPGYPGAVVNLSRAGGEICPVPVTSEGMNIDHAMKHYPKARLAYLTPSHQYPLGGTMPLHERLKLLEWAARRKMWIIEDDYDSELRYNGRPIPSLQGLDTAGNVIYIGTFSKILFPALRIAYVVLPSPVLARQFRMAKSLLDRQGPVTEQAILADFISNGHLPRHLRRMRTLYKQRQDELIHLLRAHLPEHIAVEGHDAGMHVTAWLLQHRNERALARQAEANGLVLLPVQEFCIRYRQRPGFLMGYTGFSGRQLKQAVLKLKKILI